MMAVRVNLAVLFAALALACCGDEDRPPPAPVTILQDDALLIHGSDAEVRHALDDIRSLGVDWVRVTAGWSAIAPAAAPPPRPSDPASYPQEAWAPLDRLDRLTRERGLRLAIDIAFFAPAWAVREPVPPPDRQVNGIDARAYADFAEAVARRYPGAVAFTVWNEPNFHGFWMPQWRREGDELVPDSPHAYRELLLAALPRIEEAAPEALVLIGATASLGETVPDDEADRIAPLRFVRELACVDDRLRPLRRRECESFEPLPGDGFAHHPLSLDLPPWRPDPHPDNVRMGDLERMVSLLERLHETGRTERRLPLYVTEYGYQTNPPDPTQRTSLDEQARWLPEADRIAHETAGVAGHAQFLLRDLGERPGATPEERWRDSQMGLRLPDGPSKPAERSFALALAAERRGPRRVSFWVHVRGSGRTTVRIARRAGGRWLPLGETFETDDRGVAERDVAADPSSEYRLEVERGGRYEAGVPLVPR